MGYFSQANLVVENEKNGSLKVAMIPIILGVFPEEDPKNLLCSSLKKVRRKYEQAKLELEKRNLQSYQSSSAFSFSESNELSHER